MSKQVPFIIHVRVVPDRGNGKRVEHIRALQKLAILAYEAIEGINGVQPAIPGGGQASGFGDIDQRGGLGGFAAGTAVKPQIGESPAQLMLAGFYESSGANAQIYDDQTRFSGGETYTGPGAHPHDAVPKAAVQTEVKTLKDAIEDALTATFPDGTDFSIFRIDYSGVVYGDRGFHFPVS